WPARILRRLNSVTFATIIGHGVGVVSPGDTGLQQLPSIIQSLAERRPGIELYIAEPLEEVTLVASCVGSEVVVLAVTAVQGAIFKVLPRKSNGRRQVVKGQVGSGQGSQCAGTIKRVPDGKVFLLARSDIYLA